MTPAVAPVLGVGGGHDGLVAACVLARAGRRVVVPEVADRPGGGSRNDETIPGHRFNRHAAARDIINMTRIPGSSTSLARAWSTWDGRIVGFHRSIDATVESNTSTAAQPPSCAGPWRW